LQIREIYYEDRVLHIKYVFTCNCGSHLKKIGKTGQGSRDALCTMIKDSNFQKLVSIICILQGKQLHVRHQIEKKVKEVVSVPVMESAGYKSYFT
jgi:hypothetical protein